LSRCSSVLYGLHADAHSHAIFYLHTDADRDRDTDRDPNCHQDTYWHGDTQL
jgi:hypothetical protein